MFTLFLAGMSLVVFELIMLIYLWPLYISPNPDKPLRWYYPFTCQCFRDREVNQANQNQDLDQTVDEEDELTQQLLNPNAKSEPERNSQAFDQIVQRNPLLANDEHKMILQDVYENVQQKGSDDRLSIRNVVKRYGKKKAVNDLSLTVFKNEILVLLGHNGAGKTTTISMFTRLEKATSGQASIFVGNQQINLFSDDQNVSDFISVCPQENVLCNRMTVKENITFFGMFKNVENLDDVIERNLQLFNLQSKADTLASDLSGGQKRKLQLCIALMGESKLVLLDEPTSGMDPTARRETWEIIKQVKQDKIIILTTHYMDEAEVLADRVAIISKGTLQCCGTPLFLKKKFGQGFFIQVTPIEGQFN